MKWRNRELKVENKKIYAENIQKEQKKEENLEIQDTGVRLTGEEENLGIGYEIVIGSEKR